MTKENEGYFPLNWREVSKIRGGSSRLDRYVRICLLGDFRRSCFGFLIRFGSFFGFVSAVAVTVTILGFLRDRASRSVFRVTANAVSCSSAKFWRWIDCITAALSTR